MRVSFPSLKLLFVLTTLAAPGLTRAQGMTWQEVAPMNVSRSEMRAAVIDGKFYVVGGFNASGQQLAGLEVYDPSANTWTTRAPAPRGMDHHMVAAHGGRLYVLKYDSIYVYDPATNAWSARDGSGMQARGDGTAVTVGDHIYVIGGGPLPIQRYAPATGQWETRASLQTSRGHVNAVLLDGKIWVVGGRSSSAAFASVEVYDPATNTVRPGPAMDSVRSGHAAEAVNGRLYVAGGEAPGSPSWRLTSSAEVLNPSTGDWNLLPSPPLAVHGQASASWNGRFYVIGGATVAASAVNTNRVFYLEVSPSGLRNSRSGADRAVGAGPVLRQDAGKVVLEAENEAFQVNGRALPLASPAPGD